MSFYLLAKDLYPFLTECGGSTVFCGTNTALHLVGTAEDHGICTETRHEHGASGGGNTVHPADQWFCAAEARDGGGWNTVSTRTPAVTLRAFTEA